MDLARRSITSAAWSGIGNLVKVVVLIGRSIVLARLLPVSAFGIYAFANSITTLSAVAVSFGMGGAFLHRVPETQDEAQAAAVHFTMKLIFVLAWTCILALGAAVFSIGQTRTALLVLTGATAILELAQTPQLILARRVVHRRLALIEVLNALLTTGVATGLALRGATLWALLATDIATAGLTIVALYLWHPVWSPRLAWESPIVKYFLSFGSRNFLAGVLQRALNQIDDIWCGAFLGDMALGFYSKAYRFATYPRSVLAAPIDSVAGGTYAELKGDRLRLSRAFFRTNAFLVRTGFLASGLLALTAPEFIRLALGTKWLPMLNPFRLMLIFLLLDPVRMTVSNLFVAVGEPEKLVRTRFVQLAVLGLGLFGLGSGWGIAGVAVAVDAMLIVGMGLLVVQTRAHVNFSLRRLLVAPGFALVIGMVAARLAILIPGVLGSPWRTGLVKSIVYGLLYTSILFALEREQTLEFLNMLDRLLPIHVRRNESEHRSA